MQQTRHLKPSVSVGENGVSVSWPRPCDISELEAITGIDCDLFAETANAIVLDIPTDEDSVHLTDEQLHIQRHMRHGNYDPSKTVDENISVFNMRCVVGMVETGEIKFADLEIVGGIPLVAAVAKAMDSYLVTGE